MRMAQVRAERGTVRDLAAFGGLNLTDGVHDGELAACENLSTRRAPYLATRSAREAVAQYEGADAYYRFDGHTVVCAAGRLLFDGEDKGALSRGGKQFAVVGTTLVIFPDKLMLDVQSGAVTRMDARASFTGAVFTENAVTMPRAEDLHIELRDNIGSLDYFHAYDCTLAQFARAWNGEAWDLGKIAPFHRCIMARDSSSMFVLMDESGNPFHAESKYASAPDGADCDASGRFCKLHSTYRADVFRLTHAPELAELFAADDLADCVPSGTYFTQKRLRVAAVDGEENRLSFTEPAFDFIPTRIATVERSFEHTGNVFVKDTDDTTLNVRVSDRYNPIPAGSIIGVNDKQEVALWVPDVGWRERAVAHASLNGEVSFSLSPVGPNGVTIRRVIPDLDCLCEHQNRLWGVCNAQNGEVWDGNALRHVTSRVIVASALGEPTKFWQFDGVSTDSYQLAVGGEGDFTAICSYGGAVLAFKERKLHKILGGYPAEYYLTSRDFEGVQHGCAKSLAVIGGALFYKGVRGVYRYEGGAAACVSKKLGEFPCEGVGGTDGRRYYLSADGGLYVLDTQSGVWLREDGAHVTDFAGNEMLVGDTVFRIGTGAADADTPFSAEFAPFGERDGFAELRYVRLSLEVEIGKGAYLAVEVRTDGAWRTVGTAPSGTVGVTILRLPPMRCGEMRLRLSGRGDVTVRSLRRQYLKRSDRAS
ncbi:MAG: hypothetical protein IJT07_03260 [Oscillospiraceae bacterium]|nr:hypothetical protein [Oscillospiraceae bacterium]